MKSGMKNTAARNVLVTGGSRGIGRACVEMFSRRGDRVFFTYKRNEAAAAEVSETTGAAGIRAGDTELLKKAVGQYGRLGVLVNNAGIAGQKMFQDITEKDWDEMFGTNMRDMFLTTKAFYDDFIFQKYGRIINISSMWGIAGASCEVHYSASKAAVIGFTKALAKEAAPSGVTVNCIAPGVIDTDMNAPLGRETLAGLAGETPAGRLGTPEDVAALAVFLASDEASFITGQVIGCDGGFI